MEMRLGKTLVVIRWLSQFSLRKILVLVPKPVLGMWQEELACEGFSSVVLRDTPEKVVQFMQDPQLKWCLANFETVYKLPERESSQKKPTLSLIAKQSWDAVVIDESTNIRSPKAIRTQMCKKGFAEVAFKTCLSGLPNPESYLDFFEQFAFVFGQFAGCKNYWQFRHKYFDQYGYDWVLKPWAREYLKRLMSRQAFFLQRANVRNCVEKLYERRMVELPEKLRQIYSVLEEEWGVEGLETKYRVVVATWLNRLSAGAAERVEWQSGHKVKELLNLMQTELAGRTVVVWVAFNNQIGVIKESLNKIKVSARGMSGLDSFKVQEANRIDFRNGKFQVLICQIKLGKYGLDFSRADAAIYMSNSWELENRTQSEARVINPNKKTSALIVDILTEDTIEEDVYRVLRKKGKTAKSFNEEVITLMVERLRRQGNGAEEADQKRIGIGKEARRAEAQRYLAEIGILSKAGV